MFADVLAIVIPVVILFCYGEGKTLKKLDIYVLSRQLKSRLQPDISQFHLSKTVVIRSTCTEIAEINGSCLERLPG